jgi:hypothetical protein
VTELKDYQYLDKLNTGESTNIYLTLSLDGESFDSAYANAAGEIEFQFRAYYEDNNTTPVVVTEYKNEKGQTTYVRRTNNITTQSGTTSTGATTIADALVPLAAAVKTGDATPIAAVFVVFMAGVVLLILASRKKGAAGRDEK